MSNAKTVIPPSYPALEAEVYHLLYDVTARQTELPPPSSQRALVRACQAGNRLGAGPAGAAAMTGAPAPSAP